MWKRRSAVLAFLAVLATVGCIRQSAIDTYETSEGTSQPMKNTTVSGWDVTIVTSGGITGRGLGEIAVASSGDGRVSDLSRDCDAKLESRDLTSIAGRVANTEVSRWKDSYASPANPHGYADQIRYELTLTRTVDGATEKRTTFWYDENLETLPEDLNSLRDSVWDLREKLLAQCGK